ncbi:MAG: phage regulatory CII family protein [Myxococcota bacterium]|nr:phage regulatory CII family protein [Myxococcota bacterium]
MMKYHSVLKNVVEAVGAKQVAYDLKISSSLVYKWCAEPPAELGDDGSGARNPLDRLMELHASTNDSRPIEWLCSQIGGYYVPRSELGDESIDNAYIQHTQTLLAQFSDLLQALSESISHEGRIDEAESTRIRREWQLLQGRGEAFVHACEIGRFDPDRTE